MISVTPLFFSLHLAPATPHYPSAPTKSFSGKISVQFPGEKEKDATALVVLGIAPPRSRRLPGRAELAARLNLGESESRVLGDSML